VAGIPAEAPDRAAAAGACPGPPGGEAPVSDTLDLRDSNALQQVRQAEAAKRPYVKVENLQAVVEAVSRKGSKR